VKPHNARGNIPALYIGEYHGNAGNPLFINPVSRRTFSYREGEGRSIIV